MLDLQSTFDNFNYLVNSLDEEKHKITVNTKLSLIFLFIASVLVLK